MGPMHPVQIKTWIEIVQGVIPACASIIGGFWLWIRFVLERGLLPPSQMDVGLQTIGLLDSARIVELVVRINNKGSSALVVTDLRIRLRYLSADDEIKVIDEPNHAAFGRLNFPHAHVLQDVGAEKRDVERTDRAGREDAKYHLGSAEFLLIQYDTFVQPGDD